MESIHLSDKNIQTHKLRKIIRDIMKPPLRIKEKKENNQQESTSVEEDREYTIDVL